FAHFGARERYFLAEPRRHFASELRQQVRDGARRDDLAFTFPLLAFPGIAAVAVDAAFGLRIHKASSSLAFVWTEFVAWRVRAVFTGGIGVAFVRRVIARIAGIA